ncbi:ketohexokinase [Scaptodrosophila lebanonensis]|uniref:Ketohexokinase n=1 Tax=Drosophila lebanonensis TaxID=7225 RepID=A0A6J2TDG7_DROLE|nr:ketohexokinase [Scaptodrosophila lebanonensis]
MSLKKTVLCVGCTVIDFVTINASFPEEDSDRRCLDGYWQRGGNASNVSTVLQVLGARVEFFGMLSRADGFRVLLEDLRKRDIGVRYCPQTDKDPPFSSVILAQDTGSRTIVHCNKNYPYVTAEDFKRIDLSAFGWVHFEARCPTETIKMIQAVVDYRSKCGDELIISLDFETLYEENLNLCDLCDYVVLSKDLALKKGWKAAQEACLGLERDLIQHRPAIICPWGSDGAGCLDSNKNYRDMGAYKANKIVDTLGAGDSFMAGFIYATLYRLYSLSDAVDFANQVASHKITNFGYDHITELK